ncbi:MAG: beta-phosphoglucomutase [Flavobacteriales bacterium]|jgi:beta-phosphoglucomutase
MAELMACIFDMDGVIVNSTDFHFNAWKKLADELRIDIDNDFKIHLKGISRVDSLEKILAKGNLVLDNDTKLSLMRNKNEEYLESITGLKQEDLLPGVLDFLKECKANGVKIALGSSSKNADIILEKTDIAGYFDEVIDGNKVKFSKPDPEVFLKGAAGMNIAPNEIVVFEDALSGVQAAKSGGFFCVALGNPEELKQADYVIDGLHQINLDKLKSIFNH